MTPNYTARKSVVPSLSPLCIIFFWLIVPLIIQIFRIVAAKKSVIEFYDDKIVTKGGVFNTYENQSVFMGVYSVSLRQSFFGHIFNYGDIIVDCPGRWDIASFGIKDPQGLKKYLESKITARRVNKIVTN